MLHASRPLVLVFLLMSIPAPAWAQTGATGAIAGVISDATGAVVPGATVRAAATATGDSRTTVSQSDGSYVVPLLPPGDYTLEVRLSGFQPAIRTGVRVTVTETTSLSIQLALAGVTDTVEVSAAGELVQARSSTLGRVVDARVVQSLPLVTRNFTQIIGLSPGVTTGVTDAGSLGRASENPSAHGNRSYDNNFQLNGLGVNDIFQQGTISGGVPVPNPDTIQEFKVQTGQFEAAFGRNAGASVNLVTRSGTNAFRGAVFEFFRDRSLNANDYFSKEAGLGKPVLDQNQFGFTLGGPIVRNRFLFFTSYQGTRQTNGVSSLHTILSPPLTDDRSPAAIGALFAGQRGVLQNAFGGVGPAVLPDGSNINPIALRLLQMQLPDGTYLMPTPQRVDSSQPFATRGSTTLNDPSAFDEDQVMVNLDVVHTDDSRFSARIFGAGGTTSLAFPAANVRGFSLDTDDRYVAASVAHNWVLGANLFNEARFGYGLLRTDRSQRSPFTFSGIGVTSSPQNDTLPTITITGAYNLASSPIGLRSQTTWQFDDAMSWIRGRHNIQAGGGFTRAARDFESFAQPGVLQFQSFPDFLLGLSRTQNGTNVFSNIIASVDLTGLFDRATRNWEAFSYVQDTIRVSSRLTVNLGLRYEYLPQLTENLGRPATVDPARLNPDPPASGSLEGLVLSGNFPGTVPAGVTQTSGNSVLNDTGAHTWAPRFGFALRPFETGRIAIRGGYGVYHSRTTGQVQTQTTTLQPFGELRISSGPANGAATFASPFPAPVPDESSYPKFVPYTPTSNQTVSAVDPDLRPGRVQQFSLGVQSEVLPDLLVDVAYVGSRGDRLQRSLSVNQAALASAASPIRGVTTNTVNDIRLRKPYLGWSTEELRLIDSRGEMEYDGLEVGVTKRYSHGLQLQGSYTYSRTIESEGANVGGSSQAGGAIGNQNDAAARRGPSSSSRPHRFVASWVYDLPGPDGATGLASVLANGWSVAGVLTAQSGQPLTFTGTNSNNAYGIASDRAQLASGCTAGDLVTPGTIRDKLDNYFNLSCVGPGVPWVVIGDDGVATDFGNSGVGIVRGVGQHTLDLVVIKRTGMAWPSSAANLEFRVELFNALNTVQFANPSTSVSSPAFGRITGTSVSPRIIQVAVKLHF
jgi:hypothetical protein